jgi:uncharacterized membrane protein
LGWGGCSATAFRWDATNGMVVSLGSLDGGASRADDVSADGSVTVGCTTRPTGRDAARDG